MNISFFDIKIIKLKKIKYIIYLLKKKYHNELVYRHNIIHYDMKLILEVSSLFFLNKYKILKDKINLLFKDLYLILPSSLKNLDEPF